MKQINWGIIGCGAVTEIKSGPAFNKIPHSTLVAVMRRDSIKAQDYAKRHQVPRWYDDAAALINDPEVNAIYIATPPSSHAAYAMAAMHAGKPVYVEKPMALNEKEATQMAAVARELNARLVVAHYRREQPFFKKIQTLLDENTIGTPGMVNLQYHRKAFTKDELKNEANAWRVNPAVSGGGLFHDIAPHQIDILYHLFGPVETVTGLAANRAGLYKADDLVMGNILFKNKVAFNGVWNFAAATDIDLCEITGTAGKIIFPFFNGTKISVCIDNKVSIVEFEPLLHVQQPMIEKVVQYFLGNAENPCSADEGEAVMHIMEKMVQK